MVKGVRKRDDDRESWEGVVREKMSEVEGDNMKGREGEMERK